MSMSSLAANPSIASVPNQFRRDTLHRFARSQKLAEFLARHGVSSADLPIALDFFRRNRLHSTPGELIDGPFSRRRTSRSITGRFSADDLPVFYAALEEQTAQSEVQHRISHPDTATPGRYHNEYFTCVFAGQVRDLRPHAGTWPCLIGPTDADYPACVQLARDATASGTDAFYTRSVRNAGGTCAPVFAPATLDRATMVVHKVVVFEYDAAGTLVKTYQAP